MEAAAKFKTPLQIVRELKPIWSSILVVDGKHIKIKKKKGCWYVGVDVGGDIPNYQFRFSPENKSDWIIYFRCLKLVGYKLKYLVSDGNKDILAAAKRFYPEVVYQTCIEHYLRKIDKTIGYQKIIKEKRQQEFVAELKVRELVRWMLVSSSHDEFLNYWQRILYFPHTNKTLGFIRKDIRKNLFALSRHFFYRQLPRTNNHAENLIKQYERRLKSFCRFQSPVTANGYMHLLTIFLRFKPYTDARKHNRYKNGKSRLQLADVDTSDMDWLDFSRK